jgi:peroxiredoxin
VAEFLAERGVDFPTFIKAGKDDDFVDGLDRRWTGAIPATFVYDGRGKLVRYWEGKADYKSIRKRVLEALDTKESP